MTLKMKNLVELTKSYKIYKVCNNCHVAHLSIPETSREWIDEGELIGFMWECQCKSTMFVPTLDMKKKIGSL